jgi:hypothetical protein
MRKKDTLEPKDIFTVLLLVLTVVCLTCGIIQLIEEGEKHADQKAALHAYALKTKGHLEQFKSGSHVESRYAGSITTGSGKNATTNNLYTPVSVDEWSDRIIYFDGRPPYYPEDHDEWLEEYRRIREERKRK